MYNAIDKNRRTSWLLIFLFIGLIAALGWVYGYVVTDDGPAPIILALIISLGMTLIAWFAGDKVALSTTGAKEITERQQLPELWNVVENLSITAGVPMPRVYLVEDSSPNAFATGRDPKHASLAVTTGLLERLSRTELEGVISHELSHVKNFDVRVMMLAVVLVGSVTLIGDLMLRMGGLGRRRRSNDREGNQVFVILGFIFILIAPIVAQLMKLAISREREYLADASGALLTRYPEGLAAALEKIREANIPLQSPSPATNHLWIAEPSGSPSVTQRLARLFSTHPPIEERIKRLRGMI